jgi:hypothetical protein
MGSLPVTNGGDIKVGSDSLVGHWHADNCWSGVSARRFILVGSLEFALRVILKD